MGIDVIASETLPNEGKEAISLQIVILLPKRVHGEGEMGRVDQTPTQFF
jgi:hypothetical protein